MSNTTEISQLVALEKALPSQIHAAAHAVSIADQRLSRVLTLRAAGQPVKAAEISVVRMAFSRAQRNAEDLQRIQSVLPAMLEQARDSTPVAAGSRRSFEYGTTGTGLRSD